MTDPWAVGPNLVFDIDRSPVLGRLMIVMRRTDGRPVSGFRDGICPLVTLEESCTEEEARNLAEHLNRLGETLVMGQLCPENCEIATLGRAPETAPRDPTP